MDLHLGTERGTAAEIAAIDSVVTLAERAVRVETERVVEGGTARAAALRTRLLPGLWALQDAVGWISPGGLASLCDALGVPPAEAYGVATFYDLLQTTEPPEVIVRQCDDLACSLRSARPLGPDGADVARIGSPCLGQCDRGAAAVVQRRGAPVEVVTPSAPTPAVAAPAGARLLRRIIADTPGTLDAYRRAGGYRALTAALAAGPDAIIAAIVDSGLTGRGGAAFPTGVKWRAVADAPGTAKHVVANADESEPGTFKDRVLMERDPFALVEALTICGLAVGATRGWIYVRGEYPAAARALDEAIDAARNAALLGSDVAGSGTEFDIEVRRGAGAYICGEETALLESIEGFRGEPRNKPPFPTTHGLFGCPTVVNNVETLVNVLDIVTEGAAAFRAAGTTESPGTRLFCLSGHVARPGVYELPLGTSLGAAIDAAGGVADGRALQAVLLGGAAGSFATPDQREVPLSFEATRAAGLSLGSGVVMVFDDTADLRAIVRRASAFFAHESCGQCVPCRVGTQRQMEALATATPDPAILDDLEQVMGDASICGLGHAAATLVRSARRMGVL